MKHVYALLIDTNSIQPYIFSSNKLKMNLGASYIISNLYKNEIIENTLNTIFHLPNSNKWDFEEWKKNEKLKIFNLGEKFEVGYVGGGNALFLFSDDNENTAKELPKRFVQEWTKQLLVFFPSIQTSFSCLKFNKESDYNDLIKNLQEKINKNKWEYSPIINFPNHGFNQPFKFTDLTSEKYFEDSDDKEEEDTIESDYISATAYSKLSKVEKANQSLISVKNVKEILQKTNSKFTRDIEKFGQQKGHKNYIAIVHIDGNSIGAKFKNCLTINDTRRLSLKLDSIIEEGFLNVLKKITEEPIWKQLEPTLQKDKKNKKSILPIRPIVMSGDDITFVCEGTLGIYLAVEFINSLKDKEAQGEKITFCAGVAITNTKFPFYRGYQMAEEACRNAKKKFDKDDPNSYIDFHVQIGGYSGKLDEVRETQFIAPGGSLIHRPYLVGDGENSIDDLMNDMLLLSKIPSSIIHDLRNILWKCKAERDYFIQQNKNREKKSRIDFSNFVSTKGYSPRIFSEEKDNDSYSKDSVTHFYDMIELMEFYPSFQIEKNKSEDNDD